MAKLTIADPKTPIKYSTIPQTSTLALPLSLATQRGKAVTQFAQAVAGIQKDLHQIEDENQLNEVLPKIVTGIQKDYETHSKSTDLTNGPKKFEKKLDIKNYAELLKGKNKNVTRLLEQELNKQKIKLLPNLVTAITSNLVDQSLINIDTNLNTAMLNATSSHASLIALGTVDFDSIINNKNYEALVGPKKWKAYTDKKRLQLAELQLEQPIKLKPKIILEFKDKLIEEVGTEKAEEYLDKARVSLVSKTTKEKKQNILAEVADNETKMAAFVEIYERINRAKHDVSLENEVPSIADLHDAYELGFINEVMYNMLINAVKGEEGLTDPEMFEMITVALYSAESVERMDDIKRAYLLDPTILRKVGLQDITLFTAIVDRAKKDFTAHTDYKSYSKLIDANLKNLTFISTPKHLKKAQELDFRKELIHRAYTKKVLDGMTPKNAYLSILQNEMDINAIPNVKNAAPSFLANVKLTDAIKQKPDTFFNDQNDLAYTLFAGGKIDDKEIKGHGNIQKFKQDLAQLDFMQKLFIARLSVAPGENKDERLEWALEGGNQIGMSIFKTSDN
jgi:hypothetical protein